MLTDQEVEHIAKLARIKITDQEREKFKGELSRILDYVAKLNEVNTEAVGPLYQTSSILTAMRKDQHDGELEKNIEKGKLLKVPRILNK